jgi:hypothetical protein
VSYLNKFPGRCPSTPLLGVVPPKPKPPFNASLRSDNTPRFALISSLFFLWSRSFFSLFF